MRPGYSAWSWSQSVDPRWRPGPEPRDPITVSRPPRLLASVCGISAWAMVLAVLISIAAHAGR